jgi:hypothetical protein
MIFPSLCHAKQALGDSLTDCLLVDAAPVVTNDNPNDGAAAASIATTTSAAADIAESPIHGGGTTATSEGCTEPSGGVDDDQGVVPLVVCDGDMLFAGWCDALQHHYTKEQCEEY